MWLTEFREQWGLSIEGLGTLIRRYAARKAPNLRVSDILLERLETEKNFRTVPKLADLIAQACGATQAQRDEMVLERFREKGNRDIERPENSPGDCFQRDGAGRPKGTGNRDGDGLPPVIAMMNQARGGGARIGTPGPKPEPRMRPVVMIDRDGKELMRYRSIVNAIEDTGANKDAIICRIKRTKQTDEFETYGVSFRLAEEWDRMTEAQRKADARRTIPPEPQGRGGARRFRAVTVIDLKGGQVTHYDSMNAAAEGTGFTAGTLSRRTCTFDPAHIQPIGGNYIAIRTEDWKRLPPEKREALAAGKY